MPVYTINATKVARITPATAAKIIFILFVCIVLSITSPSKACTLKIHPDIICCLLQPQAEACIWQALFLHPLNSGRSHTVSQSLLPYKILHSDLSSSKITPMSNSNLLFYFTTYLEKNYYFFQKFFAFF